MLRFDVCKVWFLLFDILFYFEMLLIEGVRNLIDVNEGVYGDFYSCFVKSRVECYWSVSLIILFWWFSKFGFLLFFFIFLFIDVDNYLFILFWSGDY